MQKSMAMKKEKWVLKARESVDYSRRELDTDIPVYAVEEYFVKEGKIHLQLYDINHYLECFSAVYLKLLKELDWKGFSEEQEYLFLGSYVGVEKIQGFWVEKEIDENDAAIRVLRKCSFVCIDDNGMLINGFNHPSAKLYYCESKLTSYILSYKSLTCKNQLLNCPKYSAHVDVGQGCCSFVFDETSLIGVDCSNKELPYLQNHQNYQNNIDACLDYIGNYQKKQRKDVVFDAFVLTHSHYDHYSGIYNLVNSGHIKASTDFYLNVRYISRSGLYNNLIKLLLRKNVNVIHAIPQNGAGILSFLYPLLGTVNAKNPNEVSVIACINCESGDFIFPGDMVEAGWHKQLFTTSSVVQNAKFFAVAHHGSETGYSTSFFPNNPLRSILMVRNNAYSNVPDPDIFDGTFITNKNIINTNDLKNNNDAFYLIDLKNGKPTPLK